MPSPYRHSRLQAWVAALFQGDGLKAQLMRRGVGSLFVKLGAMVLALVMAIVLARLLEPEGYGIYAFTFALVSLLAIPAQFGLPILVVRETAKAQAQENWPLMRGIWRWATLAAGVMSLLLALTGAGVALGLALTGQAEMIQLSAFAWGLLLVPLIALGNLRGAALRGLRRVVSGQLPEHVLRPGLLVLLALAVVFIWPQTALTAPDAMALHALAALLAFLIGAWLLKRARPIQLTGPVKPQPEYHTRGWLAAALPLGLLAGMQMINLHVGVIALGLFATPEDVGVYRVVMQGGTLIAFGLSTINMLTAPYFARLYAKQDHARMQALATLSARIALALALPVALAFILSGGPILHVVFGEGFARGHLPLAIIAMGQLINAGFGSVGNILNMTGHERETASGLAIAAACNALMCLTLVPFLGLVGAAIASALTWLIWNTLLWQAAITQLKINTAFRFS